MNLPKSITVCEVGLRDGIQNEQHILEREQKNELIRDVQLAGVRLIEVGSLVNPRAVPQMADTDRVFANIEQLPQVEYRVLVLNQKGLERAAACGMKKAKLTVSASLSHQRANANTDHAEIFAKFSDMARYAAAHGLVLSGAISTAFGCPFEGAISDAVISNIVEHYLAIGINELSLSDSTGMADPALVYHRVSLMQEKYPQVMWNLHFHNTRNMGLANVLAAMQAGASRFDASLGGVGGCPFAPGATGNIATEDLLNMCELMGIETGVDLPSILVAARKLQTFLEHDLPSGLLKAGRNCDLADLATAKKSGNA